MRSLGSSIKRNAALRVCDHMLRMKALLSLSPRLVDGRPDVHARGGGPVALHVAGMQVRWHPHHASGRAHVLRVDQEGPRRHHVVGRCRVGVRRVHGRIGRSGVGRIGGGLEVVRCSCATHTRRLEQCC